MYKLENGCYRTNLNVAMFHRTKLENVNPSSLPIDIYVLKKIQYSTATN